MRYGPENDLSLSLLVALARAMQGMKRHLLPLVSVDGLTIGQFDTLEVLYHKGPLCVNDLLEKTLTTSGNIDVVLNNLIGKKMITKITDPEDGRRRVITLTEKGHSYMKQRFPVHIKKVHKMMGALSTTEKQQLKRLLIKLAKSL